MDSAGLTVTLTCLVSAFQEEATTAKVQLSATQATAASLDCLEARVAALQTKLGIAKPPVAAPEDRSSGEAQHTTRTALTWDAIRADAEARLRSRGVDPAELSLDGLLNREQVQRIERRFQGGFRIDTRLDCYDVAFAVVAGLCAALVDFLIVRIPRDTYYLSRFKQDASPLTEWMHSLSIPDNNWLAKYCKASYDRVREVSGSVEGFSPKSHRLQTLGHDPLLGLVFGTIDILRGGMTAISRGGDVLFIPNTGEALHNPLHAMVVQILHVVSDGFTKMGLPAPGWPLLQLVQAGKFGEHQHTVAEISRFMYVNGYDCRHFLTMSTSVAAAEAVLRSYFGIRKRLDPEYSINTAHEAMVAGSLRTDGHPRFQAMAVTAHAIAAAASAGKVVVYSGNPLAVNYAQWVRLVQALHVWMGAKLRAPSDVLMSTAGANWMELSQGWPVIDVADPSFPSLVCH